MPVPVAPGFAYDFVSGTSLAEMSVRDGRLVLPSGQSYAFLILPEKSFELPPDGVRHLARLRAAGATVVPFEEAVAFMKARTPDFAAKGGKVNWIHRRAEGTDYWFVASPKTSPCRITCSFRVAGRRPELWNPETGAVEPVATYAVKDGVTTLPITFGPCASRFVVFRAPETGTPPAALPPEAPRAACREDDVLLDLPGEPADERTVTGAWQVAFPNGFRPNALAKGAEERVVFDALADWTKRPEEGIRHFSGTAVYSRRIDLKGLAVPAGGKVILDLGAVRDFAEVTVNGRAFPVL